MRMTNILFAAGLACCVLFAACGKQATTTVDTRALEKTFATGPEAVKAQVEKAVAEVKAKQYNDAIASLGAIVDSSLLSKEQQAAVKDMVAQLSKAVAAQQAKFDLDAIRQSSGK